MLATNDDHFTCDGGRRDHDFSDRIASEQFARSCRCLPECGKSAIAVSSKVANLGDELKGP